MCIPGYNVITNIDENKGGTAIALEVHIPYSNINRSLNSRILTVKVSDSITICNVYAYSGTQNFSARDKLFREQLLFYLQNAAAHLILGGRDRCQGRHRDKQF